MYPDFTTLTGSIIHAKHLKVLELPVIVKYRIYCTCRAGLFLDNGSVNTLPQQQTRTQQYESCVFFVVCAEIL